MVAYNYIASQRNTNVSRLHINIAALFSNVLKVLAEVNVALDSCVMSSSD